MTRLGGMYGPDATFLGFDLSEATAIGDKTAANPGYFFVIQQQGRHCRAGAELISAFHTRGRMDRIAKRTQFVNIASQSAAGDFEPRGEIGPGPIPAPLKE